MREPAWLNHAQRLKRKSAIKGSRHVRGRAGIAVPQIPIEESADGGVVDDDEQN